MQDNPEPPSERVKEPLSGPIAVGGIVLGLVLTVVWVLMLFYGLGWLVVWVAKPLI